MQTFSPEFYTASKGNLLRSYYLSPKLFLVFGSQIFLSLEYNHLFLANLEYLTTPPTKFHKINLS